MFLCQDLINLICENLTDKSTTRLLRTCKQLQLLIPQTTLKYEYDSIINLIPNFKYRIKKNVYRSNTYIKNIVSNSCTKLTLTNVELQIDKLPANLKHLEIKGCKIIQLPETIEKLCISGKSQILDLINFRSLKYLDIDSLVTIKNFPPNLKVFKYWIVSSYVHIPKIPSTVIAFQLDHYVNDPPGYIRKQLFNNCFPINLRILVLNKRILQFSGEELILPETIERLYLNIGRDIKIKKLPNNVKYLHMEWKYFDLSRNNRLKYVSLGKSFGDSIIDFLPDCLEILDIKNLPYANITKYPTNLKIICTSVDHFQFHDDKYKKVESITNYFL